MQNIAQQLRQLNSNGTDINLPELLRYRDLAKGLKLQSGRRSANMHAGAEKSLFKGRGMEFDEARIYQAGDDIRNIDWRVTARTGKAHTKVFREERERPVFVFVDLSESMHFGTQLLLKSVQAAHTASLLSFAAIARGDKLGAVVFNQGQDSEVKPSSRQKSVFSILEHLIDLHQETSFTNSMHDPSMTALERLRFVVKPGSMVHLISDFSTFGKAHFDILAYMTRHCEIIANQIYDPFEMQLPKVVSNGSMSVTDGKQQQLINFNDVKTNQEYKQNAYARQQHLARQFSNMMIPLRLINAGQAVSEQLQLTKHGYLVGETMVIAKS